MLLRSLGACVLVAAVTSGGATASGSAEIVPSFLLGTTTATPDDEVSLRVAQVPRLPRREVRIYLVPAGVAASIRSRFDSRLSFIGTVRAVRRDRLVFTAPPLDAGRYALAYWCRGCLPTGQRVGIQRSPALIVEAPAGEGCPTTRPNGSGPRGPQGGPGLAWHGNGEIGALLRSHGNLVTNALGGYKLRWAGGEGLNGKMVVRYRMRHPASEWLTTTRTGTFGEGYRVWPSQMGFTPGCWQIVGRLDDVALSFVVQVVLGSG
jgi:hypothetical protein